jgi:hypothetical protein
MWEELSFWLEQAGLQEIIGAPVFMYQVNQEILETEKDPITRKKLLEVELENSTNTSIVNFAGHLQMVGKKR